MKKISAKATIWLLILLFIPFVLTTFGFEPYPAIILPSGPGNIRKKGQEIDIPYKKIYGLNAKKEWMEIDPVRFSYPIPIQYFPLLLDIHLGFKDVNLSRREKWVHENFGIRRKQHKVGTEDVVFYLKQKLNEQNLDSSQVKIVEYIKTVSLVTNHPLSTKVSHEEVIHLH